MESGTFERVCLISWHILSDCTEVNIVYEQFAVFSRLVAQCLLCRHLQGLNAEPPKQQVSKYKILFN